MKKRLLVILLTALLIMSMAISSFSAPALTPLYSRLMTTEQVVAHGGKIQDTWDPYQPYSPWTCPNCGNTIYVSNLIFAPWDENHDIDSYVNDVFVQSCYYDIEVDTLYSLSIVNDTFENGCVVEQYKNVDLYCDYYLINGAIRFGFHTPKFTAEAGDASYAGVFNGDTNFGTYVRTAINSVGGNFEWLKRYAIRLTSVSLADVYINYDNIDGYGLGYDDGFMVGDTQGYNRGYQNGYNNGRINGQADAEVFDSFGSIFDDIFSGIGGFFDPFFDIGIGQLTIGNMLGLLVTSFIIMLVVKIIRG